MKGHLVSVSQAPEHPPAGLKHTSIQLISKIQLNNLTGSEQLIVP